MNKKNIWKKKILIWNCICFVLLTSLDRISKFLTELYCKKDDFSIISDILEITYMENYGGIMGGLKNQKYFFIFIVTLFSCLIVLFLCILPKEKKFFSLHMFLIFILSGSIGNLIDRIWYGYVLDFIYIVKIPNFPVFNLSDVWISLGTICSLFLFSFRLKEKDFEFLNFKQNKYREIK